MNNFKWTVKNISITLKYGDISMSFEHTDYKNKNHETTEKYFTVN